MKSLIWLSFDLGVRGDFEGVYSFLDAHNAKECGDNLAAFWFEYKRDLVAELTKEIKQCISIDRRTRIYALFPSPKGKHTGRFIIGKRKAPPWAGFAPSGVDEEDVSE